MPLGEFWNGEKVSSTTALYLNSAKSNFPLPTNSGQLVYPSYFPIYLLSPLHASIKLFTKTGVCPVIAAAVLLVGKLEQSPMAQTFENLLDLKVAGSTSTNPGSLTRDFVFLR